MAIKFGLSLIFIVQEKKINYAIIFHFMFYFLSAHTHTITNIGTHLPPTRPYTHSQCNNPLFSVCLSYHSTLIAICGRLFLLLLSLLLSLVGFIIFFSAFQTTATVTTTISTRFHHSDHHHPFTISPPPPSPVSYICLLYQFNIPFCLFHSFFSS